MDQRTRDEGLDRADRERVLVRRRPPWARVAMYAALGMLLLLVAILIFVWIEQKTSTRPILLKSTLFAFSPRL